MAWNYDPTTLLGVIRLYIGDTQASRPLLTDAEVQALVTLNTRITAAQLAQAPSSAPAAYLGAAVCADAIAGKLAGDVDYGVSTFREQSSQKAKAFTALAASLRAKAGLYAVPYVGGRSIAEKQRDDADTGAVQPGFSKGMHDDLSVLPPNYDPSRGS